MCDRKISIFQIFLNFIFLPWKLPIKNGHIKISTDSSWPEFSLSIIKMQILWCFIVQRFNKVTIPTLPHIGLCLYRSKRFFWLFFFHTLEKDSEKRKLLKAVAKICNARGKLINSRNEKYLRSYIIKLIYHTDLIPRDPNTC